MSEKVTLPLEVANAIEQLRSEELSNFGIITGMATNGKGAFNVINQWSYQNGCRNTDKLISALVNGYEIDEADFNELSGTDIYLGLLSLSVDYDKYSWFLKGAAQAFKQRDERVIELWNELKSQQTLQDGKSPKMNKKIIIGICPRCENEQHLEGAQFCSICGLKLLSMDFIKGDM